MWENLEELGTAQMKIRHMLIASWILKTTHKHTLRICNTHCFSTATMVARTRLNTTLYLHCLSCFFYRQRLKMCESPADGVLIIIY